MSRAKTSFTPDTPLPDHWFHILLALADDSRHGLGIIQEVAAQTDGRVQVWPGMLYLALKRMTDEGLVAGAEAPEGFVAGGGPPPSRRARVRARVAERDGGRAHLRTARLSGRVADAARSSGRMAVGGARVRRAPRRALCDAELEARAQLHADRAGDARRLS